MNRTVWHRYAAFYQGRWHGLGLAVALGVAELAVVVPVPLLVKRAVDHALPLADTSALLLIAGGILLLRAASAALTLIARHLALTVTKQAVTALRDAMLLRLHTLPRSFFDGTDRQRLHTVVVQDSERIDVMSNAIVAVLLPAVAAVAGLSVLAFMLQPVLFLTALAFVPPALLLANALKPQVRARVRAFRTAFEHYSRDTDFLLRRIDLIRANDASHAQREREQVTLEELRAAGRGMAWLQLAFTQSQSLLLATGSVAVLLVGSMLVLDGRLTTGELLSFYVALGLLLGPLKVVWASVPLIVAGRESLDAVFALLDVRAESPYPAGAGAPPLKGHVQLRNASFAFGDRVLFRGIDLELAPGRITAIMGANGSGKTTLARLVMGEYRPQEGAVSMDGHDYSELRADALRRAIGYVSQDPEVFRGRVRDNIAFGAPAEDAAVEAAARSVDAHGFIDALADRYETVVGHDGCSLSGGERQRIALARAMLRQPRVLLLDEPSVHMDSTAVAALVQRLRQLPWRPAVLVITHDAAVAACADERWLLRDGALHRADARLTVAS